MDLDSMPTEILTQVFLALPDVSSVIALSSTCHRLYDVYHSSKKLQILQQSVDAEFGPIDDIIQLLTHNASQHAHIRRNVLISEALLQQAIRTGRIAQRYEEIYPFKKWKNDFANRRLLKVSEQYNLRRALYRLWLFDKAYHNSAHVRVCRGFPEVVRERAALLQNFTTPELAEMHDAHVMLREIVANNVCPSNGKIRQKFQKRYPNSHHQLLFNIHLNYPPTPVTLSDQYYHNSSFQRSKNASRLLPTRWHEPGFEGWGDDISHYYVVEDMMKLDPEQILHLRDHCPLRADVESYVRSLGEWFTNNGETFSETLAAVARMRGEDVEDLKFAVQDCELGIAVAADSS